MAKHRRADTETEIIEVDHRPEVARLRSLQRRDTLDQRLTQAFDGYQRAWERGFAAGIECAAQKELARGTRDFEAADENTAPYPIVTLED